MPKFLPDVHEVREDFCDYLGECLAFDAGLGVLIEMLEEIGELDDTLIVVSGDHGIPGIPRAKCNLYDIGCEVAMAMRWPGKIRPGRVVDDFINLMDLGPTFMDAAGEQPPDVMDGKSLLPIMLSGKKRAHRARPRLCHNRPRTAHFHCAGGDAAISAARDTDRRLSLHNKFRAR